MLSNMVSAKRRYLLVTVILLYFSTSSIHAQSTSDIIDHTIESKPYQDPKSMDSIIIWSDQLEQAGRSQQNSRGIYYANRFRGFYYDYKGDMTTSVDYFLKFLRGAQDAKHQVDVTSAISDLVYMYITLGQYEKAKPLLTNVIKEAQQNNLNQKQLSSFYNNLGIVYKRETKIDSAAWAYNKSLEIKESINDTRGLMDLKINLSSLYSSLGDHDRTIALSQENLESLGDDGNSSDIILNLLNVAAGHTGKEEYNKANAYYVKADSLAMSMDNLMQQELTSRSLSTFHNQTGRYKQAYEQLLKSTNLKSELFNEQSNTQIATLREEYEAEKRELENIQLSTELGIRNSQIKLSIIGLIGLLLFTSIITWLWNKNKKKNELLAEQNQQIHLQNDKLKQLNKDKNNLISLVSHDLSGPFSAIKVWAQGLHSAAPTKSIDEAKHALLKISDQALQSIDQALSIDKLELQDIQLTSINLLTFLDEATTDSIIVAEKKNIKVNRHFNDADQMVTTEVSMLKRIVKNLLSNAIKYSNPNTEIDITSNLSEDMITLHVKDQGIGISPEDQKTIFERYDQGSGTPTSGEKSHGLGLSIVKRLVEELGGIISVKSELEKGSTFTVRLPL